MRLALPVTLLAACGCTPAQHAASGGKSGCRTGAEIAQLRAQAATGGARTIDRAYARFLSLRGLSADGVPAPSWVPKGPVTLVIGGTRVLASAPPHAITQQGFMQGSDAPDSDFVVRVAHPPKGQPVLVLVSAGFLETGAGCAQNRYASYRLAKDAYGSTQIVRVLTHQVAVSVTPCEHCASGCGMPPPPPDADFYALPGSDEQALGGFLELDVNVPEIDVACTLDTHIP
jgi:hypothetical protein